jgi:hypothetical protein
MLVCNDLHINGKSRRLDLLEALKSGSVELVEPGKDDMIALPPTVIQQLSQLNIPPQPSSKHAQMDIGVHRYDKFRMEGNSSTWTDLRFKIL